MELTNITGLKGEVTVPGDKSISHRSIMFGSIAKGTTEVHNVLQGADCLSTMDCFRRLGIEIEKKGDSVLIHGKGLHGLTAPDNLLDVGNSGTTTRLISGILAGQPFDSKLSGDESLNSRPMKRIIEPLRQMGANISSILRNDCAPLYITPARLHGILYDSPVASAQVKSAVLLAGLYAEGETRVTEPALSRNHTELMLRHFGAEVDSQGTTASIRPARELYGQKIHVPGDISSAAYFIAAGLLVPDAELLIRNVGINPTRDGILKVCRMMGADITLLSENHDNAEPVADLLVRSSSLKGCVIEGPLIPTLIDELPVIAVIACFAQGETVIRDAAELKVKESNRIDVMVQYLSAMGCDITGTDDGMIIRGGQPLHGTEVDSHLDHRIAMSFAVASLVAEGETTIKGSDVVTISYPGFFEDLARLCAM